MALTVKKKMKTIKNWQCPHCAQDSDRHWNLVEHIRRWHRGIGQPIDQGNTGGGKKTSFSNLNATHIRKRSQSSYNSSRVPVNYYNQTKDREDVIDEVHRFFTEIDEKRRKIEEIIEIRNKFFMVPISMPYINPNYISTEDMEELSHPKPSNQDKPHSHKAPIQSHDYTIGIASQKSKTENGPQDLIQSKKKETKWSSIRTEYLFEPEWDVNIPPKRIWVCKRNSFGDIIDVYKVFEAPYEELRDLSKRWWKNNTLHQ
ncbi:MAG: hypothetical protein WA461_06670 [Nitrososphaeraceae archaeon]